MLMQLLMKIKRLSVLNNQYIKKTTHSTNTPFLYSSCVDTAQPNGYENTNLKEMYLKKKQTMCTMVSPEIHIPVQKFSN